jgi:hypothetical protein
MAFPLFHVFVAEVASEIINCFVLLSLLYLEGKTIHLEDLVVKEKMRVGAGYALYSEIIKQGKRSGA